MSRIEQNTEAGSNFVRSMLAGHSALGIGFAALILLVCFSGTLAVFHEEFLRWEQPTAPMVPSVDDGTIQHTIDNIVAKARDDQALHEVTIRLPSDGLPRLRAEYHDHESGKEAHWYADASGNLAAPQAEGWTEFMSQHHYSFHGGRWGVYVVGISGVALLSLLMSGIIAHPRIFRDAFALRLGGSRRLQEADIHNRLSVWGLPFHIAISLSGAFLGLAGLVTLVLAYAAYNGDTQKAILAVLGPQATADATPAPIPAFAPMLAQVLETAPNARPMFVHFDHVGTAGQIASIAANDPRQLAFAERYTFDATGKLTWVGGYERGSVGMQTLAAMQPLHFGSFGGILVKLAYGVLGIALCVITSTGITIWLARRRDRGRPAPHWERVWAAIFWGQPIAFTVSAITALLWDVPSIPSFWAATLAVLALAGLRWEAALLSYRLRLLTALLLTMLAVSHGMRWQGATDPMMWWVNGALLLAAGSTGLTLAWQRKTGATLAQTSNA
jgi:uncharacterized iron-regulated membrane protein